MVMKEDSKMMVKGESKMKFLQQVRRLRRNDARRTKLMENLMILNPRKRDWRSLGTEHRYLSKQTTTKKDSSKPWGKQSCAGKEDESLPIIGSAINSGHIVIINTA